MNKKAIAIDIDGVLCDFESRACDEFGHENRHLYSLYDRYPKINKRDIENFVVDPDNYVDLAPIFGGICLLNLAKARGREIVLLTSRDVRLYEVTLDWLSNYNIYYDDLFFQKNKAKFIDGYNKHYPDQQIEILVDDGIMNLQDLPIDVVPMAWEQPWNKGWYPRAKYSNDTMQVVTQLEPNTPWLEFFTE